MSTTQRGAALRTPAAPDVLPALRLLSAPPCDPPYDDEPAPAAPVRPVPAPAAPRLRLVPPPPSRAARAAQRTARRDDQPVARSRTAALPPVGPVARALVQRLVEVRAGVRPLPQLQRYTTPGLYAELERHLRPRPAGRQAAGVRQVLSVHVQDRADGVAEVCATVRDGGRARALALRLEGVHGRWTCTLLLGL